ncbi:MAG: hypothetical protein RH917_03115 [Lacipirellulaceae bacterium]
MAIVLIVLLVLIFGVLGYYSHQAAKKRRAALSQLADSLGWVYTQARDHGHDERFAQFDLFRRGSNRFAYNTLVGQIETPLGLQSAQMGDYHYATRSTDSKGKSKTTHHHRSYLVVEIPLSGVPSLTIRPEHFFDRVGSFFGFDDIDFESAEFSDKFHVKSQDKRFAYDLVHPRMMEFLLNRRGPIIDVQQGWLCIQEGGIWKPEEFLTHLQWSQEFFSLWPQHLIADFESKARV